MPKDEKSPEVEVKDPEAKAGEASPAEKEFDDVFKSAAEGKKADTKAADDAAKEEKADAGDTNADVPADEGATQGRKEEKKEDDGEDKKPPAKKPDADDKDGAEETAEERIERKAKELKDRKEKEKAAKEPEDEPEPEPEPPPKAEKKLKVAPKAEKKEAKKEPPAESEQDDSLDGLQLDDDEREYVQDYGEAVRLTRKMVTAQVRKELKAEFDAVLGELVPKIDGTLTEQNKTIATLKAEIYLTEQVPDWKKIVYEHDPKTGKMAVDKDGVPVHNKEFWSTVDKWPKLWQALAASDNPEDNVEVLRYYKEAKLKDASEAEKKKKASSREKFEAMHGNSPEGGKPARESSEASDFSGAFNKYAASSR